MFQMIVTYMGIFFRIKKWFALKKAKEEEKKKLSTDRDMLEEEKEFLTEAKGLKKMILKKEDKKASGK